MLSGEGSMPPAPSAPLRSRALSTSSHEKLKVGPLAAGRLKAPQQRGGLPDRDPSPPSQSSFQAKIEAVLDLEPEIVIGHSVRMRGELHFHSLLRVDGLFEGSLNSSGSLVVGALGTVIGPVTGLKVVHVSGRIQGNVVADKIVVTSSGSIEGAVLARRVLIEEGGFVSGSWTVCRYAPDVLDLDEHGNVVRIPVVIPQAVAAPSPAPPDVSSAVSSVSAVPDPPAVEVVPPDPPPPVTPQPAVPEIVNEVVIEPVPILDANVPAVPEALPPAEPAPVVTSAPTPPPPVDPGPDAISGLPKHLRLFAPPKFDSLPSGGITASELLRDLTSTAVPAPTPSPALAPTTDAAAVQLSGSRRHSAPPLVAVMDGEDVEAVAAAVKAHGSRTIPDEVAPQPVAPPPPAAEAVIVTPNG